MNKQYWRYFLFVITLITNIICYSQSRSGNVLYKVVSSKSLDTITNDSIENKQTAKYLKRISEQYKNFEYSLEFNSGKSFFMLKKIMENDESGQYYSKYAEIIAGNHKIYVDIRDKVILKQKELHGETFLISDSLNNNWKIFKNSKLINGYKCYKAEQNINNHKIIAWFTNDIPIPFGPDLYVGLPGLILRLETPQIVFYAHKITFYDKDIVIKKLAKGIKMTTAEYDKYLKDKIERDGFKREALKRMKKSQN